MTQISATGYCHIGSHALCFADGDCECLCHLPIVRSSDPATSHEAAEQFNRDGRASQVDRIMHYVRNNPGQTAGEIGLHFQSTIPAAWKRLSDAKNLGLACQGTPKKWNGRNQITWWPTEENHDNCN